MQPTQSPSPQASHIPPQSPPDQQQYHILQQPHSPPSAIFQHPPGSQSPQAGQPGPQALYVQQPAYGIPSDGYVAATAGGFAAAPQSGPPHQGPPVIRGIQSGAPPTPPQQDMNKMQQPPPQQIYVPTGGANGTANVRQGQQLYRGATTTATSRAPRGSLTMQSGLPVYSPLIMPPSYHPTYTTRQQATGFVHFQNSQMPQFSNYQYYLPQHMMPTPGTHRGAAVPNAMVANAPAGMQNPVGQGPIQCVLAAPGQQGLHMTPTGQIVEKKKRQHAVPIIDPITRKNVLDDLDPPKGSGNSMSENEYQDQLQAEAIDIGSQDLYSTGGNGGLPNTAPINARGIPIYGQEPIHKMPHSQAIPITAPPVVIPKEFHQKQTPHHLQKPDSNKPDDIYTIHPPPSISSDHIAKDVSPVTALVYEPVEDPNDIVDESVLPEGEMMEGEDYDDGRVSETGDDIASQLEPTDEIITEDTVEPSSVHPSLSTVHSSSTSINPEVVSTPSTTSIGSAGNLVYGSSNISAVAAGSKLSPNSVPFSSSASIVPGSPSVTSIHSLNIVIPSQTSLSSTSTSVISAASEPVDDENYIVDDQPVQEDDRSSTNASALPVNVSVPSVGGKSSFGISSKAKDSKIPVSASSSSSSSDPSENTSKDRKTSLPSVASGGKMTLNEKEISKSTSSHSKSVASVATMASDRKESVTSNSMSAKKGPSIPIDRNENIITFVGKDQSKKSSTSTAPATAMDLTSANNNVGSRTAPVDSDEIAADHDADDDNEASLNNNNFNLEGKISSESIQSTSSAASADQTATSDSNESNEIAMHTICDYNDNRTTEVSGSGDSSSDSAESESSKAAIAASDEEGASASAATKSQPVVTIQYNEGQWSPYNPDGSRTYDRSQLLTLRDSPYSKTKPEVTDRTSQLLRQTTVNNIQQQHSLLPSFASNKRPQMGGMVMRSGVSAAGGSAQYNKQASMSGVAGKSSSKGSKSGMIHVSLSLREDVKLNETENAWRPTHLRYEDNVNTDERAKETLRRKVRGILNKLTPEKFEILVEQIMSLQIDTAEKISGVMELVFEKAIDEPNFSLSYARLCGKLIESKLQCIRQDHSVSAADEKASNLLIFRHALIDKTQQEFQNNVLARQAKENQLRPIMEKIKECTDPDKKIELQANLEEQERKIRRRSAGTVRFIGELFKMNILNLKVTRQCIASLLDANSEDKLECLCNLLTTVGKQLEKTPGNNLEDNLKAMKQIVERKKISNRVRFMLQNVIDLQKKGWESKRAEGPKTMEQIQKETEAEQMNIQMLNYNTMPKPKDDRRYGAGSGSSGAGGGGGSGGGSGGMSSVGGGGGSGSFNKNSGGDTWYTKTSKGNRVVDANKLGIMLSGSTENPTKLGGISQFQWNPGSSFNQATSTKSPFTTTSNSFAALSQLDSNKGSTGPRNKGSYSKNSMERDRHDRPQSRTGSSHGSRENSSSRSARSATSARSASHSYGSGGQISSRSAGSVSSGSGKSMSEMFRGSDRGGTLERDRNRDREIETIPFPTDPSTVNRLLENFVTKALEQCIDECATLMRRYAESSRWNFFYHIFSDYLHLRDTKTMQRKILAQVYMLFFKQNLATLEHFIRGYEEFSKIAYEILIDVPGAWPSIFQFLAPLINKKYIPPRYLWNDQMDPTLGKKFVNDLIVFCTREYGPNWTRNLWRESEFTWSLFVPAEEVDKFVKDNNFEFVENDKKEAPIFVSLDLNYVMERIKDLLTEGVGKDGIIDFINGNTKTIDKQFARQLTTTVCSFAIKHINNNYKLDKKTFDDVCIPLLSRFIGSLEDLEIECLFAIQVLITQLEHPKGLLSELFNELYDKDVINQESFIKWRDSKEEQNGKGVAVKGLTQFFREINSAETSDENN